MLSIVNTKYIQEQIRKRPKIEWKVSHTSAQLDKTQVHLFDRQPSSAAVGEDGEGADGDESEEDYHNNPKISDETFFAGLSRLTYVREPRAKVIFINC
jgi:hypothetical protein